MILQKKPHMLHVFMCQARLVSYLLPWQQTLLCEMYIHAYRPCVFPIGCVCGEEIFTLSISIMFL